MASQSKDQSSDEISKNDHKFKEEPGITDLVLVVEDKKLFVNKSILAITSPVFKRMFTSEFKEKKMKELKLPEKSFEAVVDFLECIYPNIYKPLTCGIVIRILPLMHEYACECQLEECHRFLVKQLKLQGARIKMHILLKVMFQTDMYGLEEALEQCVEVASKYSLHKLETTSGFKDIPTHVKEKLYYNRARQLEKAGCDLLDYCNRFLKEGHYGREAIDKMKTLLDKV